jgi:hypothetical protein
MILGPVLVVSICTCAWQGGNCASAGHGGLTHIAVVFLIVKLAAAGNDWCCCFCSRGGWSGAVSPSPASILTRTQVAADMTYPTFQAPWLQLSVVRVFAVVSYWKVLSTGAQIFIVDGDGEGGGNVLRLT